MRSAFEFADGFDTLGSKRTVREAVEKRDKEWVDALMRIINNPAFRNDAKIGLVINLTAEVCP
jgi:hypothetical protein